MRQILKVIFCEVRRNKMTPYFADATLEQVKIKVNPAVIFNGHNYQNDKLTAGSIGGTGRFYALVKGYNVCDCLT